LEPTYVALDLETTGLDIATDSIVEIGAVRFNRDKVLDRHHTLVNPGRALPRAVKALTGITDEELSAAPPIAVVAGDLEAFLAGCEMVGHNITGFDLPVLANAGISYEGAAHDTNDLADLVLPGLPEYSLAGLCRDLKITNETPHRALSDAEASMGLFLHLQAKALTLPSEVLDQVAEWLQETSLRCRDFFLQVAAIARASSSERNTRLIIRAPTPPEPLRPLPNPPKLAADDALGILTGASERPDVLAEFEDRAEQKEMTEIVSNSFGGDETPLIVEAGTGTGKSLAYLIPAAAHALASGDRVVVSTATINLQEQLLRKDLPAVKLLLEKRGDEFRACQLKGRRNYLCLSRFQALRTTGPQNDAEAQIATRILIWLTQTETGDRSELRLRPREEALWTRLSAEGAECSASTSPFVVDGTCFLQRARKEAEGSHVVVVNHALLLANVAAGGQAIPPYSRLIIDEAHHLEEEATRRFGFSAGDRDLRDLLERCNALAPQVQTGLKALTLALGPHAELTGATRDVREAIDAVRPRLEEFAKLLVAFIKSHASGRDEPRMLITRGARAQPDWSDIEIGWENLNLTLRRLAFTLEQQQMSLSAQGAGEMVNVEILRTEVDLLLQEVQGSANGLALGIEQDDPQRIVWLERHRADGTPVVSWVPLAVDETLQDRLYADLQTLVLTGATLASGEDFSYLQQRLGLMDATTHALGSPFQYDRAALVLLPSNIPEPSEPGYMQHVATAVTEMATASKGRGLILFTSHAALRNAHEMAVEPLRKQGIVALAQGIDGSPRQLVRALQSTPNCVVFGTSSFWEGIDIPGEALSLLVITRLPFNVPTEPVFAARSATYDDPFREYALPQSILRFKQGFGRLIRSRTDRGVMAVLDRRITSREYGRTFADALPGCTIKTVPLRSMPSEVTQWLQSGSSAPTATPA